MHILTYMQIQSCNYNVHIYTKYSDTGELRSSYALE